MTTFRKVIVIFYMVLVTVVVGFPILDGVGVITMKEGASWLIAQIVVATAVPVALAVLKTKDFFRDDPEDVATAKKRHREEVARMAEEKATVDAKNAKLVATIEHMKHPQVGSLATLVQAKENPK